MADVYASAIGTTVLQLKEIPLRPKEYDGALCLFELVEGVDQAAIRKALEKFGEVIEVEIEVGGWPPATVRFTTHEAALSAKRAATQLTHIAGSIDTLYNERSYDGRKGEEGREDDKGRGW